MSTIAMKVAHMVEMLPASEQNLALELLKRMILAWDPDFTRLTEKESAELKKAEASGFVSDKDIDWDHLSEVYGK